VIIKNRIESKDQKPRLTLHEDLPLTDAQLRQVVGGARPQRVAFRPERVFITG
jgi:hypothetical protein